MSAAKKITAMKMIRPFTVGGYLLHPVCLASPRPQSPYTYFARHSIVASHCIGRLETVLLSFTGNLLHSPGNGDMAGAFSPWRPPRRTQPTRSSRRDYSRPAYSCSGVGSVHWHVDCVWHYSRRAFEVISGPFTLLGAREQRCLAFCGQNLSVYHSVQAMISCAQLAFDTVAYSQALPLPATFRTSAGVRRGYMSA